MKKGQVTIFIVIGLVMLLSIFLFLRVKNNIIREEIAPGVSMIVEESPSEFLPIQPFIEKCLIRTAGEGLKILGESGGYIYTGQLEPGMSATEGDSVRFTKTSDLIIPYWFYLESDNRCIGECSFASKKLPLKGTRSVETELARYVDENIDSCLNGFDEIKELGFEVKENSRPKSKVIVAADDLVVQLDYPIEVSRNQNRIEFQNFYSRIGLNLNKIYRMADYIARLEREYRFIERASLNLIVGFSAKDERMLPPMSDSAFEAGRTEWKRSIVKNNVEDIISSYIPLLRVTDTPNWQDIRTGDRYVSRLYNYGMQIPNNVSIHDLTVSFSYLDFWDIYFDLNCNGEYCQPESVFSDLLPISYQRYNFAYDLSFPVLVEIRDEDALDMEGFSFNYMLESNIRNNAPMPAYFTPLQAVKEQSSMLCDENKRTSGQIQLEVSDSLTGDAIDDAAVLYSCIDSCMLGSTKQGILDIALPVCLGGSLVIEKEGYETLYLSYDSSLGRPDSISIRLSPKKSIRVDIRKQLMRKQQDSWQLVGEYGIEEDEQAILTLKKDDFQILEYGIDENITLSKGTYEVDLSIIDENDYYIPSQEYKGITIDEYNATSFVSGRTNLTFTLTEDDLLKEKITFYVISADLLSVPIDERTIDDLRIDYDIYNDRYKDKLQPRLG